jgi:hypothetical protein
MNMKEFSLSPRFKLNALEVRFLIFALFIITFSLLLYFDFLTLDLINDRNSQKASAIGEITQTTGTVKTESLGQLEFKQVKTHDTLFNQDVMITGSESRANLTLTDSGTVELGPNTMVTLSLIKKTSLTGIQHFPKLTVVSGEIKAQPGSKPFILTNGTREVIIPARTLPLQTSPTEGGLDSSHSLSNGEFTMTAAPPASAHLSSGKDLTSAPDEFESTPTAELGIAYSSKMIAPTPGSRFHVTSQEGKIVKDILFRWTTEKESELTELRVWRVNRNSSESDLERQLTERNLIIQEKIQSRHHEATFTWNANAAGYFVWKIIEPDQKDISSHEANRSDFTLEPEYTGIEHQNVSLRGKENGYSLTLNWESHEKVDYFEVLFYDTPDSPSPQVAQTSRQSTITLDETLKLPSLFYYKINGIQKTGFILTSPFKKIDLSAFPPTLTLPDPNSEVVLTSKNQKEPGVVLTWIKDIRFKEYSVEISTDPHFEKIFQKSTVSENYYLFKDPKPGNYWWRVRGLNQKLKSNVSDGRAFVVKS